MQRILTVLEFHNLAVIGLLVSLTAAVVFAVRRKAKPWGWVYLSAAGLLFAVGGFVGKPDIGQWIAVGAGAILVGTFFIMLLSRGWSFYLGAASSVVLAIGIGSVLDSIGSPAIWFSLRTLGNSKFGSPWWLLFLLMIPFFILMSFYSRGEKSIRRWISIGIRCFLVLIFTLTLAELRLRKPSEALTVLYLVDRSLSIPEEFDDNPNAPTDLRWKRIQNFIANSVFRRGSGHELDQSGVIVFGRRSRLALPPTTADKLLLTEQLASIGEERYYTDLSSAIKLGLASFPESTSKRIVLLSDGNENLGNVDEQIRLAQSNKVQIDVVSLAAGRRNESEVLVQSVEAPPQTEQGARVPIRVLIRSHNPRLVRGTLQLRQKSSEQGKNEKGEPEVIVTTALVPIVPGPGVEQAGQTSLVVLKNGLNSFSFRQTLTGAAQSYTYEAVFTPLEVAGDDGNWVKGAVFDRPQNNSASTHVVALGQRRILFVENTANQHRHLYGQITRSGKSKFQIFPITPKDLPAKKEDMGLFLSNFDCVVLANVPAETISNDQMEVLRANTYDQGCGLVMIGGKDSFGAGAWQDTPVEKALPVDCDIKSLKVAGKGGLVMIFHASEIAEGNRWQKEIGKLAVKKLAPVDMIGVVYWDFKTKWWVPFQQVGGNKSNILSLIDKMTPNDMPDCNPSLEYALVELSKPSHQLATKHIIFISDGDHWNANKALLAQMKAAGITVTTVCITSHGALEEQKMKAIADATGGRFYKPKDPKQLPAIYIQESRIVSQSFIYEKTFKPVLHPMGGPASGLSGDLPPLHGFVRTTKKPSALSAMPIEGPSTGDQEYPILAYWFYGLGKAVAFTSDALSQAQGIQGWDRDWAGSDMYVRFWEQVFGWVMRSVETGRLSMITEFRDGKIKVTVDARDNDKKPMTNLRLEGAVTPPSGNINGGKPIVLDFKQKSAGLYEAEFKAEEAGSYFVNALAKMLATETKDGKEVMVERTIDGVRSGVTIPYSPEFSDLETNAAVLRRIAESTGGKVYSEDDKILNELTYSGDIYRPAPANARSLQPVWFWLVLAVGLLLLVDVAVRRIALEPEDVKKWLVRQWETRRGRAAGTDELPEYLQRLKSRKAGVGDQAKARKRFEGELEPGVAAPTGADEAVATDRPRGPKPIQPKFDAVGGDDYAARLLKAKRRAREEQDPDRPTT